MVEWYSPVRVSSWFCTCLPFRSRSPSHRRWLPRPRSVLENIQILSGCSNESINAGNWCMVYWRTTFCLMINWSMRARYSNPGGQSTGTMFWETWRGTGWGHLQVENQGSKNMVSWKKDKLFKSLHLSHPCPIFSLHWSTNRSSLKEKLVICLERTMILVLFKVVSPVI